MGGEAKNEDPGLLFQQGGGGKTATAVNPACALALSGQRILLCDQDPKGASSFHFRVKPSKKLTKATFFEDVEKFTKAIRGSDFDNLAILPANMGFREFDVFLSRMRDSRSCLKKALRSVQGDYVVILLDCPPNISILSEDVFRAADAILVPVIPTALSQKNIRAVGSFFQVERSAGQEVERVLLHGAKRQVPAWRNHGDHEPRAWEKVHEDADPVCVRHRAHGYVPRARHRLRPDQPGLSGFACRVDQADVQRVTSLGFHSRRYAVGDVSPDFTQQNGQAACQSARVGPHHVLAQHVDLAVLWKCRDFFAKPIGTRKNTIGFRQFHLGNDNTRENAVRLRIASATSSMFVGVEVHLGHPQNPSTLTWRHLQIFSMSQVLTRRTGAQKWLDL